MDPSVTESAKTDKGGGHGVSWEAGRSPVSGYQLVRFLGRGGMGEVWEAAGPGGVPVALKRVDLDRPCSELERQALELLKRVRHPHLLALHGYWIDGNLLIIGWELADTDLRSLLNAGRQPAAQGLTSETITRYLADAAEALDYLARPIHRLNSHAVRIQHRDIKPANLLVQGGGVKVADFGLAKALEEVVQTHSGSMTVAYAPPEFFRGQTAITSDQYSLGVTYCELRTGRLPFRGTVAEIVDGHQHRPPDLDGLSEAERHVVARALAKNPEHRWAGCVKFIGEVSRALQPGTIGSSESSVPGSGPADETARTFRGQAVSTGLLLVADELVPLPLKSTNLRAAITAATAEARVTQVFANTHDRAVEATYVFPLPDDAAVHRLRVRVGERIIEGIVREKEEARQTYVEAKREGHGAALVEQTTPNIFTTAVANILPGQEVHVEISYLQALPYQEGQYRFVFPMVVSPRYVLGTNEAAERIVHRVPAAITAPRLPQGMLRGDTVSIEVDLDAGVPLCGFDSPSHDIVVMEELGTSRVRIALRRDDEIPNRDFVLNYRLAGPTIEHALFVEPPQEDQPDTFLWLSAPPAAESVDRLPREIIFVLDRSGSMEGSAIEQAKQAARQLLDRLAPGDTFNVIAFNRDVTPLSATPLPAEERNLRRGRAFLDQLQACGGTEMLEPLRLALQQPSADTVRRTRLVVFLTDGSVHGERELLGALRPLIGRARIVGFGIGAAVNRHLINRLTAAGRGFAEYLFPGENIARVVDRTLRRLSHTVLTDIRIEWEGAEVESIVPDPCPDLYRDQPLLVLGRYHGQLPRRATIRGQLAAEPYTATLAATEARRHEGGVPLHALWARQQIEILMDRMWEQTDQRESLRKQVIELAIRHRLASEFTSLLAVEYRSAAERERARGAVTVEVPQYLPQGMDSLLDQVMASIPPSGLAPRQARAVQELIEFATMGSLQQKLGRVRKPRCHIHYERESEGVVTRTELPFVVGVLGDFGGGQERTDLPLKAREFVAVDRDNFDSLLARWDVRLAIEVPDRISGGERPLDLALRFRCLEDFSPSALVRQIPELRAFLELRQQLAENDDAARERRAAMDRTLSHQLAAIMHHPRFQRLEAAWRGLHRLVTNTETGRQLRIEVFSASKEELARDLNSSETCEQSGFFHQIYGRRVTADGGEPFGVLVGDYEFTNAPEDVRLLENIARVAATACCPFLTAASPALFGLPGFADLDRVRDPATIFNTDAYAAWRSFRESDNSRFVVLTLPRVLARLPYGPQTVPVAEFEFKEWDPDILAGTSVRDRCCWMNASYLLAERITDAFARDGWCTAIHGVESGGKVEGLPAVVLPGDDEREFQHSTEIVLTSRREWELSNLGFLPLCSICNSSDAVFFSGQTAHRPQTHEDPDATANARISARLPFVLAASRFGHYVMVIARDKLNAWQYPNAMETDLNRWLANYVNADPQPDAASKARSPLREANVQVREMPGEPGVYRAVLQLRVWDAAADDINGTIRLVLRISHGWS